MNRTVMLPAQRGEPSGFAVVIESPRRQPASARAVDVQRRALGPMSARTGLLRCARPGTHRAVPLAVP